MEKESQADNSERNGCDIYGASLGRQAGSVASSCFVEFYHGWPVIKDYIVIVIIVIIVTL